MKRLFLLSATALMATMMSAQTAARMDSHKPQQLENKKITSLTKKIYWCEQKRHT